MRKRYILNNSEGSLKYPDGTEYVGEWSGNKRNGQGVCVYSDGEKYEGEWLNDCINGEG